MSGTIFDAHAADAKRRQAAYGLILIGVLPLDLEKGAKEPLSTDRVITIARTCACDLWCAPRWGYRPGAG